MSRDLSCAFWGFDTVEGERKCLCTGNTSKSKCTYSNLSASALKYIYKKDQIHVSIYEYSSYQGQDTTFFFKLRYCSLCHKS